MRRTTILVLATLTVVAVACDSGGSSPSPTASPSVSPAADRPSSTAKLAIVSPTQGEVIDGSTAPLEVKLTGATIVQQTSTDLKPDEGHLHVILDDHLVSMTAATESMLTDLGPGQHVLKVEFVANDHAPFDPRVTDAITFEVEG